MADTDQQKMWFSMFALKGVCLTCFYFPDSINKALWVNCVKVFHVLIS